MDTLRSAPAIARPPARERTGSDLWRLLPYLMPYRVRWIAMVAVALASLVATVAIPLMTKAVIDGPVRHQDQHGLWLLGAAAMGVGISEAVLWFIRRWLVARATMGVEADIRKDLYARLQILPMSFHGRWQSGQLLSRIMNDLSTIRRFMSFGMVFLLLNVIQITVVTAILLAMYWPLGVVVLVSIVPITADGPALPADLHPVVAAGAGPVRPRRNACRGIRARCAGGEIVRPRGLRLRPVRQATHRPLRHAGRQGIGVREVLDPAGGHPQPDADRGAGLRRLRRRPRLRHDGHAGRVHHDDAVAGVAHRVVGLSCCP